MDRRVVFAVLIALVLIAGALGIGAYAYQAGVAQGMIDSGRVVPPPAGAPFYPYYGPFFFRPFGWGFGLLGCLFPLLFFLLFFALLRGFFWRGRWGGQREWQNGLPPAFDEWHRRAHESQTSEKQ